MPRPHRSKQEYKAALKGYKLLWEAYVKALAAGQPAVKPVKPTRQKWTQ